MSFLNPDTSDKDAYFDFIMALTEAEYAVFHMSGVLAPGTGEDLKNRTLNIHAGPGGLCNCLLSHYDNSYAARDSDVHYIVHLRLPSLTINDLPVTGMATPFNRFFTDYSLTIKREL